MGYGILTPSVMETRRKVLGRPSSSSVSTLPSPTGMIEDLAVVEERYQLAKWLNVSPDAVPTDAVSYTFPWKVWVPCVLEQMLDECVSICFHGNGRFLMCTKDDQREVDISAKIGEHSYLEGRLCEHVRPLCFFDRPGVLLFSPLLGPAVILKYNHKKVAYVVLTATAAQNDEQEEEEEMDMDLVDPLEMETFVFQIGQPFLIKATAMCPPHNNSNRIMLVQYNENHDAQPEDDFSSQSHTSSLYKHVSQAYLPPDALLLCTLRIPDDHTLDGLIPINVSGFKNQVGHVDGEMMMMDVDHDDESMEDDRNKRMPPLPFHVTIDQVIRPYIEDQDKDLSILFHGISHPE